MTSKKRVAWAGIGLAVVAAVVGAAVARNGRGKVLVETQKAARRDLVSVVSASGEIKPQKYVNISANVSGRITDLLVEEGATVRKGQVLARIDSTRFAADTRQSEAAVQAQRAELERAVAELEVGRLQAERTRRMHEQQLVADQALDQSEADIRMKAAYAESLRKRIAQSEAALESVRDNLEKTVVAAPMDGVVTNLAKEEGEVVIGAQSFQPTVIMTVADLTVMVVEILVDETDIAHVALGQRAEVRVDALEGVKISGEVTEIGSSAIPRGASTTVASSSTNTGNQAKDFKVTVTLKDPPKTLRPGLNATADITTARKEKVLAIPLQAVVVRAVDEAGKVIDPAKEKGEGGAEPIRRKGEEKEGVFVVKDEIATFKPVQTGIVGETEIEVTQGLSEGDELVIGSYRTLRTLEDQAKIRVETKKEKS